VAMRRKEKEERKFEFIESVSLLSTGRSLKEGLQAYAIVVEEEEGANCGGRGNEKC